MSLVDGLLALGILAVFGYLILFRLHKKGSPVAVKFIEWIKKEKQEIPSQIQEGTKQIYAERRSFI